MKRNYKYLAAVVLGSAALASCNDLDTAPDNYYVTTEQKADAIGANPELAKAGVVGISSTYNQYMTIYSEHFDFGWPAVMLGMDSMCPDFVSDNMGYNHFSSWANYNLGSSDNVMNNMSWFTAYKVILSANTVINNTGDRPENDELKLFAAQALANRAFAYFNLIQLFQQTYKGHEDLLGVPLLSTETAEEAAVAGSPRATVQEVYDFILEDLDKAIANLEECGLTVNSIATVGAKRFVSLGTAYGLRARVNLVMNKWNEAASDAQKAIQTSGATPFSIAEASVPAFINCDDHNWMWGIYIDTNDRVVTSQIVNWASHMGSFNYGYATVGSWRKISIALFNSIPDTDCRKGWWLNADKESKNLTPEQAWQIGPDTEGGAYDAQAYTQVKFAPYQNKLATTVNASDIILMRVEEMYLINAEATAMAGKPADGKAILENFVKTYRDPSYTCAATDAAGVQEAVWKQRRIEFWGEGQAYFDLLRLNKPLDRRGGGWPSEWVYNVPAPLKPFLIPQREINANKAIQSNNATWTKPDAVDDIQ